MPGRLEVTYDLAATSGSTARTALAARETALGASLVGEFDYTHLGIATRVLNVAPAQSASIAAKLRLQSGVKSVAIGGSRRAKQTVAAPYFTNDPYFTGFSTTVPPTATSTAPPSTFEVEPLVESASVPGQWNMHVIGLENAFAYGQNGNGSGITNAGALGSSNVKIAVIDVGEDATHPELASKIAYQKCFITNPTTGVQSNSTFTTDEDGHGTDVAGIAAAASNNGLGFTGSGGNSSIFGYRVQATPDDNCTDETTSDLQCSTDTTDIASAIDDAVAQNVNVITISLGGGACSGNGVDSDPVEGSAIANAVAANIVVVAAAGNDGSQPLEAPACDSGVIAAGATALADGQPNGASNSNGTSSSPTEYVASYSDFGSPGAAAKSSSAWGIVAPGGDPSGDTDADDLHWIEDIWTSTPFMSSASDTNFEGSCVADYPGTGSQTTDCRTLIAGTSMAAPTVAGAAALILAAAPAYQSPAKMKTLLCTTADDIGDPKEGCGRLNVYRAMAVAVGDTKQP
jgi:subtilisin family serine protease